MNTIKFDKKNVKVIAHRGVSGIEKENTNSAFVAAGNRSYFGIETDVHVTIDGKFVIIHDDDTVRVSNYNYQIEKTNYNLLRSIVLNDRDNRLKRQDLIIPDLEEYIEIAKKYEKVCVLELKNRICKEKIKEMIDIISGIGYLESMIFISFDRDNMIDLRSFLPDQKLQYLVMEYNKDVFDFITKYNLDLDIHYQHVNKDVVDELHKNGKEINCWTVDKKEDAEKLVDLGVDYITSNILE